MNKVDPLGLFVTADPSLAPTIAAGIGSVGSFLPSLPTGGVVGLGGGYFKGLGGESGFEVVKMPDGKCQLYFYLGPGAGGGGGFVTLQGGTTYNVSNPNDYKGFFTTINLGIGPGAGSISAAPDAWPFLANPAPAASEMVGFQYPSSLSGSTSIRYYFKVCKPFCCK